MGRDQRPLSTKTADRFLELGISAEAQTFRTAIARYFLGTGPLPYSRFPRAP